MSFRIVTEPRHVALHVVILAGIAFLMSIAMSVENTQSVLIANTMKAMHE